MAEPVALAEGRRSPDALAIAVMTQLVGQALGASGTELVGWYRGMKTTLREAVRRDPIDANLSFLLGATALFYAAEKGVNPKVNTFGDALVYTSTCLSVGYSDIFARTEAGKLIGTIVMTVGPALSGALLEPPAPLERPEAPPREDTQAAILNRLDEILAVLKANTAR